MQWCFGKHWDVEKTCQIAKQLGIPSVELVNPRDWPILKKHGLKCAIASSHPFDKGMNNPKYQPMCFEKLRAAIDASSEFGCPSVITFTGFREDIPDDVGLKNCVAGFKQIVGYADKTATFASAEAFLLGARDPHAGPWTVDRGSWTGRVRVLSAMFVSHQG